MKPWFLPSGRKQGIPFLIPDDWSPEQALAVFEWLDDLREVIGQHYQIPITELLREDHCTHIASDSESIPENNPPF